MMFEYVIKQNEPFNGTVHTVLTRGLCATINGTKTRKDYETDDYIILSKLEFKKMYEDYLDGICGNWKEITADTYDEALNVLPPYQWKDGGFFISERQIGDVSSFYQELYGKFYTSFQRWSTPRETIIKSLKGFLSA